MSVDTYFVHKALNNPSDAIEKIEYTMIGGSNKDLTRELVLLDESGKAHKATLVVDPDNVIQTIEINADGIGRKASFPGNVKVITNAQTTGLYGASTGPTAALVPTTILLWQVNKYKSSLGVIFVYKGQIYLIFLYLLHFYLRLENH